MEGRRRRDAGQGNVRQRPDGTWEARERFDGTQRSYYAKTRREALAKLKEARLLHDTRRLPDTKSPTVSRYLASWLADVAHRVRPTTLRSYRLNVNRLTPHLGRLKLDALTASQVQSCYTKLLVSGLSPRSVQQCGTVLGKALNDALRLGLVSHNAASQAQKPRPVGAEQKTLTPEQLMRLFTTTASDRYHLLWVIMGAQGLRLAEALALKWADVDWERRTLSVNRTVQHVTGKGVVEAEPKTSRSRRTVDLLELTTDALRVHRERQASEKRQAGDLYCDRDFVFARAAGEPQGDSGIFSHWKAALERAGLPYIRRHDLRHTAATLRLVGGSSLLEVMHDLGHSNLRTTGIYSHHTPAMRRASADKMEVLLRGVAGHSD